MVFNSLTEVPRNLKEGIDWLVALKGADAENNLKAMGAAVYDFLADKPVGYTKLPALENVKLITKQFLEQKELRDSSFVRKMLVRFKERLGKNFFNLRRLFCNTNVADLKNMMQYRCADAKGIAWIIGKVVGACETFVKTTKNPDSYDSAYSSEATWEASCTEDPEACAVVLVGIAPMLYGGLHALWSSTKVAIRNGPGSDAEKALRDVMKAVGYEEPECRATLGSSDISWALTDVDRELFTMLYDLCGFWAFY
ncbi:hypothetical protein, conserved [Babesia ovata]|uniref:Uncharacterized protein n=1 Tax=Babesia ovata TaxID=189622 RepID=A0A2H6K7Y6_9APIC|nr:uncharacterized protein BOVATA_005980 [Babesia ovata]GBE59105.1 hypothetical protein, conserved [Babesia ovata]